MRLSVGVTAILAAVLSVPALAGDATRAAELLRGLAGAWAGELAYRDYQTNERTTLKLTRTVAVLADGATVQSVSAYDDGAAGTVYITTLEGLDVETATWQSASIRKGQGIETGKQSIALPSPPVDETHWTIVLSEDGEDDDAPAAIRETLTRDGGTLTALKEVDPKNDGKDEFLFRNETVLTLQK